jgi:hypothetical protein
MNHIPIMPMPIPSFQRNWQTLKSSVLGQNNILPEKSTKPDDISKVENSDQNMLMDQDDCGEINSPLISYQNTAPDPEIPTNIFHQKTSENCDKNCEVTANSECTPAITNITPVKLRITVKSEKDLIEPSKSIPNLEKPSKSVLELEKSSKSLPELVQKPSKSVPELVQEPSKSVPELEKTTKSVPELQNPSESVTELVQKPSESVQELQKPSYNLDLYLDQMEESNIEDPDLDQINVVDQIIATKKTAQ